MPEDFRDLRKKEMSNKKPDSLRLPGFLLQSGRNLRNQGEGGYSLQSRR